MKLQDLRFGVEIETVGKTRGTVAEAIRSVTGGDARHVGYPQNYDPWEVTAPDGRIWKVVADASLTSVAEHLRAEVVTPVLGYGDLPLLQEVVRAVKEAGCSVDAGCGLHCHVSAEAFDGRTLANLAKLIFKQEPLIFAALRVQQSRLDRYAKPIPPEFIRRIERAKPRTREALNRLWYGYLNTRPTHYDSTRYHAVNLHSVFFRNTVEYRMGEGTLHAGKIKAYVQFALAITAKALNSRAASSRKRAFDPASARFDFRCFLLRLEMSGDEFKTARKHLLAAMPGDSAFKRGRPKGGKPRLGKVEGPLEGPAEGRAAEAAVEAPEPPSIEVPEPAPPPVDSLPVSTSCPEVPSCAA